MEQMGIGARGETGEGILVRVAVDYLVTGVKEGWRRFGSCGGVFERVRSVVECCES